MPLKAVCLLQAEHKTYAPIVVRSVDKLKNTVHFGLRQVTGTRLTLGILTMAALVFVASINSLVHQFREMAVLPCGYHIEFVLTALQSDTIATLTPILAVLPYTANYIDDVKNKFVRFFLIRTDYASYLISRIVFCFLSGGLVIIAGAMLAWGASALLFLPMEKVAEAPSEAITLLLKTCVLLFLNGGLWAVLGMTMSTIMESKYIAYASPFIVYYILVILHERYFPNFWLLSPKTWLKLELWPYGIGSAALFLLELTFLCSLIFYIRGRRRLENL